MTNTLGRLEQVDLRTAWASEASEFTPWLADQPNLALLGETIGIELECEAQEKRVGPFRADILCRDTMTGHWVLIENQLERTDHTHLGQLLTYAAGLKAVTIVWVSKRFTEEHRATIDWLNDITDERFNFFGLEIELWRIGTSPIAPKLNVVCKPNDWSRRITDVAKSTDGELSETQQLYLEYWHALRRHMQEQGGSVQMSKPLPQMWMTFPIGRTNFNLTASVSRQKQIGWVQLIIYGSDHVPFYRLLLREQQAINHEMGAALEWRELPEGKESHVRLNFEGFDVDNRSDWPRQHELIRDAINRMERCLRHRVKNLDLADLEEDEAVDIGQ
ncbi:MAG: DUF4268 domain-containing protein [Phycisphaerales bacterium]|nr:MAG: DUF4268 domain-containing protein [Phycisphaerales bacterium]